MAAPAELTDYAYLTHYDTIPLGAVADLTVQQLRDPDHGWRISPVALQAKRTAARDLLHARALEEHTERVLNGPLTVPLVYAARALKPGHVVCDNGQQWVVVAVATRRNEIDVTYNTGSTITYGAVVPLDVRTSLWKWKP
jgi:hypothetical protein